MIGLFWRVHVRIIHGCGHICGTKTLSWHRHLFRKVILGQLRILSNDPIQFFFFCTLNAPPLYSTNECDFLMKQMLTVWLFIWLVVDTKPCIGSVKSVHKILTLIKSKNVQQLHHSFESNSWAVVKMHSKTPKSKTLNSMNSMKLNFEFCTANISWHFYLIIPSFKLVTNKNTHICQSVPATCSRFLSYWWMLIYIHCKYSVGKYSWLFMNIL